MKIRSAWTKESVTRVTAAEETLSYTLGISSLGNVLVALSDKGVVMISISDSPEQLLAELETRFPRAEIARGNRQEKQLLAQVLAAIENPAKGLDIPLDMRGTVFQKRVWNAVREIPLGETSTYTEIAAKIGAPKAMRAVGTACSKCDLAIVVPCHRVLRSNGTFHGGDWSESRQGLLIAREKAAATPDQ